MQKWILTLAFMLPIVLGACSDGKGNSARDTKYSEHTKRSREDLEDLGRFPSPKSGTKIEVLAKYLPGKKARDLKEADYLKANEQAIEALDYDAAVILSTEAIKLSPSDPMAYYQRGRAGIYSTTAKEADTIADLEKAIALNYPEPNAYEFLARIYDSHKQKDKAIESMTRAIAIQPHNTSLYKERGALYAAYGDHQNAKKDYDKWIELSPTDVLPWALRGQLLESMKEYELALHDYQQAYELPEHPNTLSKRDLAFTLKASLLSRLNRHKEAISVLSQALKKNRNEDELLRLRGDEYLFLKDYKKAIADYTESIENAPDFARKALESRAKAYTAIGDQKRANEDLLEAKKLNDMPAEKPVYEFKQER